MKLIILPFVVILLFFTAFGREQISTYSESKSYQPREFPEDQKKKKKKKDKEQSKTNDSILSTSLTADTVKQITLPVSVFGNDGQFYKV